MSISYEVLFEESDGTPVIDGEVEGQTFTARGLQPFTNYTFQVAGVNRDGWGPFSDAITVSTDADGKL